MLVTFVTAPILHVRYTRQGNIVSNWRVDLLAVTAMFGKELSVIWLFFFTNDNQAARSNSKAAKPSGLRLGRSEVLKNLKPADTKPSTSYDEPPYERIIIIIRRQRSTICVERTRSGHWHTFELCGKQHTWTSERGNGTHMGFSDRFETAGPKPPWAKLNCTDNWLIKVYTLRFLHTYSLCSALENEQSNLFWEQVHFKLERLFPSRSWNRNIITESYLL